jgi:hypothetical protein
MAELARLASEIKTSQGLDIVVGPGYYGITIIRSGYVSVAVGWQQPFANYVGDSDPQESHLWVAEYSGTLSLQGEPPRVAGKTIGLDGDRLRRISAAPLESGRILRPVLVSPSVTVYRGRSTSSHRKASASLERQPVRARKRATAIAGGHIPSNSAFLSALPSERYSASESRRSRRPSAGRITPCTGLSDRIRWRTA